MPGRGNFHILTCNCLIYLIFHDFLNFFFLLLCQIDLQYLLLVNNSLYFNFNNVLVRFCTSFSIPFYDIMMHLGTSLVVCD